MPKPIKPAMNTFMKKLKDKLLERYSEGTTGVYITKLRILNKDKPFTNFAFLKPYETIIETINKIENINTRMSYFVSILGVLNVVNIPAYNKVKPFYNQAFMQFKMDFLNKVDPNEKTQKQSDNWIDWDEVMRKYTDLEAKAAALTMDDSLTKEGMDTIDEFIILSLYTLLPPRRNVDYYDMVIGKGDDKTLNYYDGNTFTFNVFKTARSRGTETLDVPIKLKAILDEYIENLGLREGDHLLFNSMKNRGSSTKITRTLNRIFGKAISTSMLRHIWVSYLLGDVVQKVKDNANAMGHSVGTDINYAKV
jgi:hypothetical protein